MLQRPVRRLPDVNRPIVPDYGGACVRGIIPALLGPDRHRGQLPDWIPSFVADADAVVLVVLDGLGWGQLRQREHLAPTLAAMSGRAIHTVAPTTTATALTSITTGLTPGEHGIVGYRMVLGGDVVNTLRWQANDHGVRRSHPPADVQGFDPFMGVEVPVVAQGELERSAFSEAHLRGSRPVGWRAPSSIAVETKQQIEAGEQFVYCYYNGVDKIAHERGFGDFYDAELRFADALVADVVAAVPAGTAVLVTADHGQVHVADNVIEPSAELLRPVTMQSGEGRFRWLHCDDADVAALVDAATDAHGDVAWVVSREQVLDEVWFGPVVAPPIRRRLGDVALVPFEAVSFHEAADSGPFELICRHGSLTADEVEVPLIGTLA